MIRQCFVTVALLAAALLCPPPVALRGGVQTDGSTGPRQSLSGTFKIGAFLGQRRGGNLFHSFSSFNLDAGESATFSGPSSVNNVFARVTGGQPSNINGTLGCEIRNANLYFLNPAGIVFGPSAHLNVSGAFVASTAHYVKLADGGRFDAAQPVSDVLTAAPPSAFGFKPASSGMPVAGITVGDPATGHGPTLAVATGKALSLVGGQVRIVGTKLQAPAGRINLIAAGAETEAQFDSSSAASPADSPVSLTGINRNNVSIESTSMVSVGDTVVGSDDAGSAGGSTIAIRAGDLTIDRSSLSLGRAVTSVPGVVDIALAGSARFSASTVGNESYFNRDTSFPAPDIHIAADSVALSNGSAIALDAWLPAEGVVHGNLRIEAANRLALSNSTIASKNFGGPGADVRVSAGSFELDHGTVDSELSSVAPFPGKVGDILLQGRGSFTAMASTISTYAQQHSNPIHPSGTIVIRAGDILVAQHSSIVSAPDVPHSGAVVGLSGVPDVEDVRIEGNEVTFRNSGVGVNGLRRINRVYLRAERSLTLDAAQVYASAGGGQQLSTQIVLNVGELRLLHGSVLGPQTSPYYSSGASSFGVVRVGATSVLLDQQSRLEADAANTEGGSLSIQSSGDVTLDHAASIASAVTGLGHVGNIDLTARNLELRNGATISASTRGGGQAGDIKITVRELSLKGARIAARSEPGAAGPAGSILVSAARDVRLWQQSSLTTDSAQGGGELQVRAGADVRLDGQSEISATAKKDGANVTVNAPRVIMLNHHSQVTAESATDGGNITIDPAIFSLRDHSTINANGGPQGAGGHISIIAALQFGVVVTPSGAATPGPADTVFATGGISSGVITTTATNADVTNALSRLPGTVAAPELRLQDDCGRANAGGAAASTFIVTGIGGAPIEPGGWLPDFAMDLGTAQGEPPVEQRVSLPLLDLRLDASPPWIPRP